jgi:hypothetical protein
MMVGRSERSVMQEHERIHQDEDTTSRPLDAIRLDKTAFAVVSLFEADAADKAYWRAQTPQARLEALELMRQVAYGYDPATARLERILEVVERPPR